MMSETSNLNDFDNAVVTSLKKYGEKIKKYELVKMLKADIACSELEINQSLERLVGSKIIKKTGSGEYVLLIY